MADRSTGDQPIDPDVDLHDPQQRHELEGHHVAVLAAISFGGAVGAVARYGLTTAWSHSAPGFPWATWTVNVSGCLLIGSLMVVVADTRGAHRLLRPFLGVGVLGGYTTFSTYTVDAVQLTRAGAPLTAVLYLLSTVVGAVAATWLGVRLARRIRRDGTDDLRPAKGQRP